MAEQRLCASCLAWFCRAEDAWCGNCGAACAQVLLKLEPDVLQLRNRASKLLFTATNLSCADLTIEQLQTPPWIEAEMLPSAIPAGGTARFPGRAATLDMTSPATAQIVLRTNAAVTETTVMAIDESPVLGCSPAELELWGKGVKTLALELAPRLGALRVRGVRRGAQGEAEVVETPAEAVLASSADRVKVVLQVNVERFVQNPRASLTVYFDGPHGISQMEVEPAIKVKNPPEIRWEGENDPPVRRFTTHAQGLSFVLSNKSPDGKDGGARNAALTIHDAQLQPPAGLEQVQARLKTALPLVLRGGETGTLAFEADFDKVLEPAGAPVAFRLTVATNNATLRKPVPVLLRPLPVYDGALAIDFGSSNTCAALVESGREYEPLAIDGSEEISPTILRYIDLSGPVPQVETGARVKRLAIRDERFAAGTANRLKQRLGEEEQDILVRPYNSTDWVVRTATEAATDYLREVHHTIEAHKEVVFRDFILTHPAVCSLRQFRNLHHALSGAFDAQQRRIRFLPEPIAALIPFFAEHAAQPNPGDYTVASFDLGGGTTDLAVVRVKHVPLRDGRMEIHPAILYSRGVRFGGEDLTDFLEARMELRIQEMISAKRTGAKLIRKGVAGASAEDSLRNQFAMRNTAELFKSSLSEEGKKIERKVVGLRILAPDSFLAEEFNMTFDELFSGSTGDLKTLFTDYVRERVYGVARLLADAQTRVGTIECIQLSGMTSYLSAVGETIRQVFPQARIERARDPKQCVVTGACLSRAMGRGAMVVLVLPGDARTTSSIGLHDVARKRFRAILPVDTPIPAEGLIADIDDIWFGEENVVLWENLGASDEELLADGTRSLSKLGTWQPDRLCEVTGSTGWPLRLRLKDFALEVHALGPAGEVIAFHPLEPLKPRDDRGGQHG